MNSYKLEKQSTKFKSNSNSSVWNFVSEPALHPMKVAINLIKPGTAHGLIFVAPYTSYGETMIGQTGSLIMDQFGNPVWFKPLNSRYIQNSDFRMQHYKGKPVLTMWEGTISGTQSENPNLPAGDPEPGAYFKIINQNYKVIKKLTAQRGFTADVHEFTITKRNTALFTAVRQVPADLRPYGGPKYGYFDDYSIQEIDIITGKLIFFWDALSHVNPADSMISAASSISSNNIWDCFHVNSVEEGPNNTLLISMRNMWAIYNIDKKTGNTIWQLGGKQSNFTFGPKAAFSWQHDARYRAKNIISMFDDGCCASPSAPPESKAHGLILKLNFQSANANIVRAYYHNPLLYVPSQGNLQKLCNGNELVGWGQQPYVSEFANGGNTEKNPSLNFLYDMRFPNQNISYRAFKNGWVGLPEYPPSIAVRLLSKGKIIVYASWNGATETAFWQVLAGSTSSRLSVLISKTPRIGFETAINVDSNEMYFQIKALNLDGKVIGISHVVKVKSINNNSYRFS